jgi:PAS domain S-box-containing protein
MGHGTPRGAAPPGAADDGRTPVRARRFSGRLPVAIACVLVVVTVELVLVRTYINLGDVGESISLSSEPVSLQVLDGGVDELRVRTARFLAGTTMQPESLRHQVSEVQAELSVVSSAAAADPSRAEDVARIREAWGGYLDQISPALRYGRAAIGPNTERTLSALAAVVNGARQEEEDRSHDELQRSLDAARTGRVILVGLSIVLALLAALAALWLFRATRRLREEVTSRDRMRRERDEAEERYRNVIEHIPAVTYVDRVDPETGEIEEEFVSPQVQGLSGYGVDVWRQEPGFWKRILDPRDRDAVLDTDGQSRSTGDSYLREFRLVAKDGRIVWVRDEATLGPPDADGVRRWKGVMLDVTAQKAADENLRLLESAVVNATDALMITAADLEPGSPVVLFVNPAFERLTGYSAEEFVGTSAGVLLGPDSDLQLVAKARETIAAGGEFHGENVNYRKDGTTFNVSWRTAPIRDESGTVTHLVTAMQDITERVETERRVRETEQRFRTLVEQIPAILYVDVFGEEMQTAYVSPQIEAVLGISQQAYLEDPDVWKAHLHPDDRHRMVEGVRRVMVTGVNDREVDQYRLIRPDGRVVWIDDRSSILYDENGGPAFLQGVMFDITAVKAAEEELTRSKALLAGAERMAELGSWQHDPETEETTWSDELFLIYGIDPASTQPSFEAYVGVIYPDEREEVSAAVWEGLTSGRGYNLEHRIVRADGSVRVVHQVGQVRTDEATGAVSWFGTIQDVTERREAESERVRNLELLRKAGEERQTLLRHLVDAQEQERDRIAADIHDDPIQKMTAVGMRIDAARRKVSDVEQMRVLSGLAEVVQGSITSLRHLLFDLRPRALDQDGLGAAIRVYLDQIAEDGPRTRLDDRLIEELPQDLRTIAYRIAQESILNARKHARASSIEVDLAPMGDGVLVRVRDDGAGFDPENAGGESSPLHFGIGSMRQRAEIAGGWWRATSAPDAGTTVEFWLPLRRSARAS